MFAWLRHGCLHCMCLSWGEKNPWFLLCFHLWDLSFQYHFNISPVPLERLQSLGIPLWISYCWYFKHWLKKLPISNFDLKETKIIPSQYSLKKMNAKSKLCDRNNTGLPGQPWALFYKTLRWSFSNQKKEFSCLSDITWLHLSFNSFKKTHKVLHAFKLLLESGYIMLRAWWI